MLLGAGSLLRTGFWKVPELHHSQLWVQDPWCQNRRFLLESSSSCYLGQLASLLFLLTVSIFTPHKTQNVSSNKQGPAGWDGHWSLRWHCGQKQILAWKLLFAGTSKPSQSHLSAWFQCNHQHLSSPLFPSRFIINSNAPFLAHFVLLLVSASKAFWVNNLILTKQMEIFL